MVVTAPTDAFACVNGQMARFSTVTGGLEHRRCKMRETSASRYALSTIHKSPRLHEIFFWTTFGTSGAPFGLDGRGPEHLGRHGDRIDDCRSRVGQQLFSC
jgi:hypothetical protein